MNFKMTKVVKISFLGAMISVMLVSISGGAARAGRDVEDEDNESNYDIPASNAENESMPVYWKSTQIPDLNISLPAYTTTESLEEFNGVNETFPRNETFPSNETFPRNETGFVTTKQLIISTPRTSAITPTFLPGKMVAKEAKQDVQQIKKNGAAQRCLVQMWLFGLCLLVLLMF